MGRGWQRIIAAMDTPPKPPTGGAELPPLPERIEPEALRTLEDTALERVLADLAANEQATRRAMAPFDARLRELRARAAEVATEQRRRERAARHAARVAVRAQAASGALPSLGDALAAAQVPLPDDAPLRRLRAFLRTGGEVDFGYPTRPGVITFTDGRRTTSAGTVGEARRLWADGWEPGAPGATGVRVHLVGTKVERLAPLDEVVVLLGEGASPE